MAYQLLAKYWPSSMENLAPKLNNLPKIVFSRTLEKAEWNNSSLIKGNIKEEILKIKQQPGKDLVLFAGADIASTFLQLGLIDLRLSIIYINLKVDWVKCFLSLTEI
jgi:dihydrofolate reductase